MGLPAKLKNFNLFFDGNSFQGVASEVVLPKLTKAMEEWRGGGMSGPVKVDMGLNLLESEITLGGLLLTALRAFGKNGVLMRFAGAYQRDDSGAVDAVEVVMRGSVEELDMGNAKAGEDTEHKLKMPLTYYKLVVNGREEIEVDMLNGVFIVDGVDVNADIRAAIGLI